MTKKTFTAAERQQIAAGWQTSGMSQPDYAALHGISDRTLREWVQRAAPPEAPVDAVRQVLRRTISELERMLEGLNEPAFDSESVAVPAVQTGAPGAHVAPSAVAPPQEAHADPQPAAGPASAEPSPAGTTAAVSREVGFLFELDET